MMTKRERIDICLNCTRMTCNYGNCERFRPKPRIVMKLCAFGEIRTVKEWAEKTGIPARVLYSRMAKMGLDMEAAINMGPGRIKRRAKT